MLVIVKPVRTSAWAVTLRQADTILRTTSLTNIETTGERVQVKPQRGLVRQEKLSSVRCKAVTLLGIEVVQLISQKWIFINGPH